MAAIEWNRAPVWGSAFKIAEAPMSYMNRLQNEYGDFGSCFVEFFKFPTSFAYHGIQLVDGFRYRRVRLLKESVVGFGRDIKDSFVHLYQKKHLVTIVIGTGIAYPLTVAMTPVSIILDIFAGSIQASLRLCQRADKEEILSILHKKVIASPVQQGVYLLTGLVALGILAGGPAGHMWQRGIPFIPSFAANALLFSALMGNIFYTRNQRSVADLPRFFRPDGYNIFIDGGAKDECGKIPDFDAETTYLRWRRKVEETTAQSNTTNREFTKTRKLIQDDLDKLITKFPDEFTEIRNWFKSNKDTYELFGFSSLITVNENRLKRKFRLLALQCHSDKFQDDNAKKEADIWTRLVLEARLDVENRFKLLNQSTSNPTDS